jgi:hypothetical protein
LLAHNAVKNDDASDPFHHGSNFWKDFGGVFGEE